MVKKYETYKHLNESYVRFPNELKGQYNVFFLRENSIQLILLEFDYKTKLQFVKIYFDTPTFDRITKDRRAKFEDIMSAVGGQNMDH